MHDFWKKLDIELHDIWVAFALLSRIPIPVNHSRAHDRGAHAAWAYPIVGIGLGAIAAIIVGTIAKLGISATFLAIIAVLLLTVMTGAMHEDGLADTADGMGVKDRTKKLAVMRDSHIGAFGVIALILIIAGRIFGTIDVQSGILALIAVGATSRASMVLQMYMLPAASETGLSASTGRPSAPACCVAIAIAAISCLAFSGLSGVLILGVAVLSILPLTAYAKHTLGGQTGDILGATQQVAEFAALAMAGAVLL